MTPEQLQLFDPEDETTIIERRLPHWQQAGAISFINLRTHDSMPHSVIQSWEAERLAWLIDHGVAPTNAHHRNAQQHLPLKDQRAFKIHFQHRWMVKLDECHGRCDLRQPHLAQIVAQSLLHFDGQRYLVTDFVIMPNHVHLLAAFPDEKSMLTQCESWKHYTATQLNRELGRQGRFWQQDGFDHLVRSEAQLQFLRKYIRDNPATAQLRSGEFLHYSRDDVPL